MLQKKLSLKQEVIGKLIKGKIKRKEAGSLLGCSKKTIQRYVSKVEKGGLEALRDKRHSNYRKLLPKQESELVKIKEQGRWRSARKALELTGITHLSSRRVQQIWVKHNLHQENIERLKPIIRFAAPYPNYLLQADIQGKLHFSFLGDEYLL